MAGTADDLMMRLSCLLDSNEEVTASQLRNEAMAIHSCMAIVSTSDIIEMLQILLKLLAGRSLRTSCKDGARYCPWISSSKEDRNDFMATVNRISAKICTGYSLKEVSTDEATKKIMANDFLGLGCINSLCIFSKSNYECVAAELHFLGMFDEPPLDLTLMNFLNSMEMFVYETMDKILSIISTKEMRVSVESTVEKFAVEDCEFLYYSRMLRTTGEVSGPLITADYSFSSHWIKLWRKVDRTSSMEFLFFKATSLTCNCGRSVDPGSTYVIMDNCHDLICEKCARLALRVPQDHRMCPVCTTATKNWMSSHAFLKVKIMMKKRKADALLN